MKIFTLNDPRLDDGKWILTKHGYIFKVPGIVARRGQAAASNATRYIACDNRTGCFYGYRTLAAAFKQLGHEPGYNWDAIRRTLNNNRDVQVGEFAVVRPGTCDISSGTQRVLILGSKRYPDVDSAIKWLKENV